MTFSTFLSDWLDSRGKSPVWTREVCHHARLSGPTEFSVRTTNSSDLWTVSLRVVACYWLHLSLPTRLCTYRTRLMATEYSSTRQLSAFYPIDLHIDLPIDLPKY